MDIFKPTPEQAEIINTEKSALVNAGPGTGKTRTAIEKAKFKISLLLDTPHNQVLFLSFSNAAIHRLATDVKIRFSRNDKKQVSFMTYHSCAAEILRGYGRFVGLPTKIRIMDTLEEKIVMIEEGWSTSDEDFTDKLFFLAKKRGFLSFETLIPLATQLLSSSERLRKILCRKYPLIIVDEFQDTSESQWNLLYQLGMESQVVAFGDPNQIIYSSMHAATEKRLEEFKKWKSIKESKFSTVNFRCNRTDILQFANALLTGKSHKVTNESYIKLYELGYRNRLRFTLALIWRAIQEQVGADQTIGFLTPSNPIAEEVAVALRNPPPNSKVPFPVYGYLARDESAYDAILLALSALRDYALVGDQISCNKAATAMLAMDLAWTRKKMLLSRIKLIVKALEEAKHGDKSKLSQLMTNSISVRNINSLVPSFVEALGDIKGFETTYKRINAHGPARLGIENIKTSDNQILLFDELRMNRRPKGLEGYDAGKGRTYILNYHKAKGREFDFVTMIVDPRGESAKIPLDEQRRLYYVCATRAKKWLGVVYYKNELGRVLAPVLRS